MDERLQVDSRFTRVLQKRTCKLAADTSFAATSEHLKDLLGVSICAETVRTLCARHAAAMVPFQPTDAATVAAFCAAKGALEFTVDAGKVNTREEGWKDLKIGVFQKREAGAAVAVEGWSKQRLPAPTMRIAFAEIARSKQFRQSWRPWAERLDLTAFDQLHVLGDGASWIWKSVDCVWPGCVQTLDVFHACERFSRAAEKLYGEGTAESKAAFERGRQLLIAEGWLGVTRWVAEQRREDDGEARGKVLDRVAAYFAKHSTRLNYAERLAAGRAIGSGAVEGQAKTLGLRLKARGARWRKKNVQPMATLICLRHSDQFDSYWTAAA